MSHPKTVTAPPCPFWRAAAVDQRHVDPDAPPPLQADQKNRIADAIEQLIYHAGLSRPKATAVAELLIVAANHSAKDKVGGLVRQTYTLNELSGGLLDKELDSRMLRRIGEDGHEYVGEFSEESMAKLFSAEYSREVTIDGHTQRGVDAEQLDAFIAGNRKRWGAHAVHNLMAEVEMKTLLLGMFGRTTDTGERVLTQRDVEIFYREGIFPHPRLDGVLAEAYPPEA